MIPGIRALAREIASHNRHCWLAAAGALFFAWLAWTFFYAVFAGAVLLFETIRRGEEAVAPAWMNPAAGGLACALFVWGAVNARRRRFRPPPDRPVLGWHLLPDALLLPARLTFAIGDHLAARLHLNSTERALCWEMVEFLADTGRVPAHELGGRFADQAAVRKAVLVLTTLGWADLHPGEDGWFYRLRTTREEQVARLRGLPPGEETPEESRDGGGGMPYSAP